MFSFLLADSAMLLSPLDRLEDGCVGTDFTQRPAQDACQTVNWVSSARLSPVDSCSRC